MKIIKRIFTIITAIALLTSAHAAAAEDSNYELPEAVEQELSDFYPSWCVFGDMLYYCGNDGIMRCLPDGTGAALFAETTGFLFTADNSVFCGNSRRITRLNEDGSCDTILEVRPLVNEAYFRMMNCLSSFTPSGGTIYYIITLYENHILCAVNADGTGNHQIGDVCNVLDTIDSIDVDESCIVVNYTSQSGNCFSVTFEK